MIHTISFN